MVTKCVRVEEITMAGYNTLTIGIDGRWLQRDERERFAQADGFENVAEMAAFWEAERKLPFEGQVIHWEYVRPV